MDCKVEKHTFFYASFEEIFHQLCMLATTNTCKTGQEAHQLKCSCGSVTLFVSLGIISSYSGRLVPVTQALQGVQLDILKVCNHIQDLLLVFRCHSQNAEERFKDIFSKAKKLAESLPFDLHLPRQCSRQALKMFAHQQ